MMTLVQWQRTRRVDHINLGLANPRYRGQPAGLRNLKALDPGVARFWAPGITSNDFDKVGALAPIYSAAEERRLALVANNIEQRYLNAVVALKQSAQADLSQIWTNPNAYNVARLADTVLVATHQPLVARHVALNIFYLVPVGAAPAVGPIDATINTHIANANNVYAAAQITFARTNPAAAVISQTPTGDSILLPNIPAVPVANRGQFQARTDGRGTLGLIAVSNALAAPATMIDVVYLDDYDQNDVLGLTLQPHKGYGDELNPVRPARPIVTVTLNPPAAGAVTYPTTLAHELGHALTGYGDHSIDPHNLMAGGFNRDGTNNISAGQIAWFRNNAYT